MRQRLTIILTFVVIIGLLVVLNSLMFVRKEKVEDMEVLPLAHVSVSPDL